MLVWWISPALEHPTTMEFGYARASSPNGAGSSSTSGAPKASTRVREESSSEGSFGTDHFFVDVSYAKLVMPKPRPADGCVFGADAGFAAGGGGLAAAAGGGGGAAAGCA